MYQSVVQPWTGSAGKGNGRSAASWASLQAWNIRFYSYNEPFLDTTGPFAGFLIPLFAWLARQESIRKGKAVKLGMEKARVRGKVIGRPAVVDKVDAELVVQLRNEGRSWREIAA